MRDLEYSDRIRRLKLLTLAYRRLRGDLIQVYKIVHELVEIRKEELFIMANLELGLRGNSFKLQKRHVSLEI